MKNLVGMDIFKKAPIVLPEMKEQTAIAEALSDVDSLISSLQKLIEKKKAIKQGAMQELLTGKKRLPGFYWGMGRTNFADSAKLNARIGWQGLNDIRSIYSQDLLIDKQEQTFIAAKLNGIHVTLSRKQI